MRLLNTDTLELETFPSPGPKPRYAIASHRWNHGAGLGSECSFQDIQAKHNLDGSGYQKIRQFAIFMRDHVRDVNHLWIDTCCIDKSSSQELQEAITAMYRWYENATACLAFLHDVDDVARLRQSEWFTRGWTLQELLAPRLVVFLSSRWEVLGHKAQDNLGEPTLLLKTTGPQLNRQISDATGIAESVIGQPEQRRRLSIVERMGWMTGRTTTRPEDMVYSLFGIFEVSMPLIYEEGQIAAEHRLRKAIAEAGNHVAEHRHLPGASRPRPSSNLPFSRDLDFVDRIEIEELERKLESGGTRVALVGLGGVGKSQLAIEYCYRLQERRPETWVLWIHAGSEAQYEASLRKLASDVNIPGHKDIRVGVFELVYHWLRNIENRNWLLVLDNADDAEFLFTPPLSNSGANKGRYESSISTQTRLDLLPICRHGSIIVTSRYRDVAVRIVDHYHVIPVLAMGQASAMSLLSRRLGVTPNESEDASKRLVAALDCMPLAIAQAAAYIKRRKPRSSIEQYLERLNKDGRSKTKLLSMASIELRRYPEAENSIIVSWQISFDHIRSLRPSAADLLSLMSFFDHQRIPESLLQGNKRDDGGSPADSDADEEAFEDDIAILRDYDFISVTPSGRDFKMHRLVQLATQRWIENTGQYWRWRSQSIDNLDLVFPYSEPANWQVCEALYPHTKLLLDTDLSAVPREVRLQRATVLSKATRFAPHKGAAREAESFTQHSRAERQELLGDEHPYTLSSAALLARAYFDQGRLAEAERLNAQVPELSKRLLGEEHLATLESLADLTDTYHAQGHYMKAERLKVQVSELYRKVLGEEHPHTLKSISNLAATYFELGKHAEAGRVHMEVVPLYKTILGEKHPETLISITNLALTYSRQGKHAEAERLREQVLQLHKRVLGEEHPRTSMSISNLAVTYFEQGKHAEAEELGVQALETMEKVLGKTNSSTRIAASNLTSYTTARVRRCQQRE